MEKIVRNYIEIKSINELSEAKKPSNNFSLKEVSTNDFQLNKFFYKQIGKEHRWIDKLAWNDQNWITYAKDTKVNTFGLET